MNILVVFEDAKEEGNRQTRAKGRIPAEGRFTSKFYLFQRPSAPHLHEIARRGDYSRHCIIVRCDFATIAVANGEFLPRAKLLALGSFIRPSARIFLLFRHRKSEYRAISAFEVKNVAAVTEGAIFKAIKSDGLRKEWGTSSDPKIDPFFAQSLPLVACPFRSV